MDDYFPKRQYKWRGPALPQGPRVCEEESEWSLPLGAICCETGTDSGCRLGELCRPVVCLAAIWVRVILRTCVLTSAGQGSD